VDVTDQAVAPERILVVGPYAPYRDGIAAYVVQQVRDLRRAGHHVEVLSPLPSAAHHHLDFASPRAALALQRLARTFDRVVLHFHPDYYFPQPATFRVRTTHGAALGKALRAGPPATLVLHEIDERWGTSRDAAAVALRYFIGSFATLQVHDRAQADELADAFGADRTRIEVVAHGHHFVRHVDDDRASARRALGLDPDAHVSLCIGFVAEHKGFDRAITAFDRANQRRPADATVLRSAELHIVGSPSAGNAAAERYALDLEAMAAVTPGVAVHSGYVSDAAFDRWLAACDLVVLPYRYIWSSGVAERAALFDRPVIATRVGGLDEQLQGVGGSRLVDDDRELAAALVEVLTEAGVLPAVGDGVEAAVWEVPATRQDVLAEVRRRADDQRGFAFVAESSEGGGGTPAGGPASGAARPGGVGRALVHLRRIGPLARPIPVSGRPGVTGIKRIQRRLLDWEIEPIIGWVDELRQATQEAVEASVALAAAHADTGAGESVIDEQPEASASRTRPAAKTPAKAKRAAKAKDPSPGTKSRPEGAPRRASTPESDATDE
jgi:glycosyltransferase involved in cell wall biosynthesis